MIIPKGKHRGKTVEWLEENDKGYYNWMIENGVDKAWFKEPVKKRQLKKKYYNMTAPHGERLSDIAPDEQPTELEW